MYEIETIISGGQTGADRAALDFAIDNNIAHGGWIPKGRKTEEGPLSLKYHLQEMPTGDYSKRTEKNVLEAEGTVIISHCFLNGGSALTREFAIKHKKPWIHIDVKEMFLKEASSKFVSWLEENKINVFNVAGPSASKDPAIYDATLRLLIVSLTKKDLRQ